MYAKLLNFEAKLALSYNLKILVVFAWLRLYNEGFLIGTLYLYQNDVSVRFLFLRVVISLFPITNDLINWMVNKGIETVTLKLNFFFLILPLFIEHL